MNSTSLKDNIPVFEKFSVIERGIISTLIYFDIFNYPLTKPELLKFCHAKVISFPNFDNALTSLLKEKYIEHAGEFYFIKHDASMIDRRIKGNNLASKFHAPAKKYSRIISKFPFVKAVFISGSLSKGYMDKDSDIDYFIVTTAGRLWICRSFLILFKKIFLLNSHKYFCVNYFVDENNLEIHDKNIYTATEINTLMPMYNFDAFASFVQANQWTIDYLPNLNLYTVPANNENRKAYIKNVLEKLLQNDFGNWLEKLFFSITLNYWKKKFTQFSDEDFKNALRSREGVSKHHPNKFQQKVLTLYREKIKLFENKYLSSLALSDELTDSQLFQ